ncbi:MAG: hypothetical protein GC204_18875 [Chloroflexi bacterium]|nr:hypothetical protein [Chloroflexota bacterium]
MLPAYFDTLRTLSQPIRSSDLPQTLEPMHRLLAALGNPQEQFLAVVVTGSTGKGTTCLNLAYKSRAMGKKVGLYTSPHLHLFRERFAVLDPSDQLAPPRIISQPEFVESAQTVFAAQQTLDHRYSTFETATALALLWFAQQNIEHAVLEIGIGGRFDAVNAVEKHLAVFTPIEAEHLAMLGGSLESVAWHKAGIIQRVGNAFTVAQTPEVMAVLEREAQEKHATLQVWEPEKFAYSQEVRLPGRLETIHLGDHLVIIDGGHTPAAAHHLRDFIGKTDSIRLIIGMLRDKNVADYLRTFDSPNVHFVYTQAPSDRALSPDELLERYIPAQAAVKLEPYLDKAFAQMNTSQEALSVVAGSLRMAAAAREAFGLLSADDLEEARLTRAIFDGEDYLKKLTNT